MDIFQILLQPQWIRTNWNHLNVLLMQRYLSKIKLDNLVLLESNILQLYSTVNLQWLTHSHFLYYYIIAITSAYSFLLLKRIAQFINKKSVYKMDVNRKLMLQAKNFYYWCIVSSANFCKGIVTKKVWEPLGQNLLHWCQRWNKVQ